MAQKTRKLGEPRTGRHTHIKPVDSDDGFDVIGFVKRLQNPDAPASVKELNRPQRDIVVEYLKVHEGLYNVEIANLLAIDRSTVQRIATRVEERRALELKEHGFSLWQVVEELVRASRLTMRKARAEGDWKLFIDTEHKMIDKLQDLGVVYKEAQQISIKDYTKLSLEELDIIDATFTTAELREREHDKKASSEPGALSGIEGEVFKIPE